MTEDPKRHDEVTALTQSGDVPTPTANETPTVVIDWHEAVKNFAALEAGDVITGFKDLKELDIFATNVGGFLRGINYYPNLTLPRMDLSQSGRWVYDGWNAGSRPPSQMVKPRSFIGQLKDITVVMLDEDMTQQDEPFSAPPRKNFVISADMYSTGRGKVGKAIKHCSIGVTGPHFQWGLTTARYKNLPSNSADAAVKALREEASQNSFEIVSRGVRRAFSGGLPGLGKNR